MTFSFDNTAVSIVATNEGHKVTVTEGNVTLDLYTDTLGANESLYSAALWNLAGQDAWVADRIAYCFGLADRRLAA